MIDHRRKETCIKATTFLRRLLIQLVLVFFVLFLNFLSHVLVVPLSFFSSFPCQFDPRTRADSYSLILRLTHVCKPHTHTHYIKRACIAATIRASPYCPTDPLLARRATKATMVATIMTTRTQRRQSCVAAAAPPAPPPPSCFFTKREHVYLYRVLYV